MNLTKLNYKLFFLFVIILLPNLQETSFFYLKFLLYLAYLVNFGKIMQFSLLVTFFMICHAILHELAQPNLISLKLAITFTLIYYRLNFTRNQLKYFSFFLTLAFIFTFLVWLYKPNLYYILYSNKYLMASGYFTGPFTNHIEAGLAALFILIVNRGIFLDIGALGFSILVRSKLFIGLSTIYFFAKRSLLQKLFIICLLILFFDNLYNSYQNEIDFIRYTFTSASTVNRLYNYFSMISLVEQLSFVQLFFGIGVQGLESKYYAEVELIRFIHLYGIMSLFYLSYFLLATRVRGPSLLLIFIFITVGLFPSALSSILCILIIQISNQKLENKC